MELSAELEQCIPDPDDTPCRVEGILLGEAISAYLGKQPRTVRQVFLRRYWYLESISTIAGTFSMSESKVKSMLFRSRNGLREYLREEGYRL